MVKISKYLAKLIRRISSLLVVFSWGKILPNGAEIIPPASCTAWNDSLLTKCYQLMENAEKSWTAVGGKVKRCHRLFWQCTWHSTLNLIASSSIILTWPTRNHQTRATIHFKKSLTNSCVANRAWECAASPLRSELIRSLSLVRWVASLAASSFVADIEAFIAEVLASVTQRRCGIIICLWKFLTSYERRENLITS